jgi:hypothetical protein
VQNAEDQHPFSVANNRGNMDGRVPSSQPPVSYNSGYVGHTNQMIPPQPPPPPLPLPQFHPSGPHGNFCGPPVPHHANNCHHQHHYLIIHTIYSHHPIHLFQTSFHIHLNLNREHNLGTIMVPVLRDISMVDMTEDIMN